MISKSVRSLKAYVTETTPARVRLSSNEFPYDLPEEIKEEITKELFKTELNKYPDPNASELKGIIADFIGVREENILLGNGSDELIYYLSLCIGEPSDPVFIPVPTFSMYEIASDVFRRMKVISPLNEEFDINFADAVERIEENGPKLAFFAYPNNPTGNLFSEEKIRAIRDMGLFVVLDEAYYHYSGETFIEEAVLREDTAVLRTLSKIGLAGIRVGILVANDSVIKEINKVRLPFNVTLPSQVIAKVVLTKALDFINEKVREVIKERDRMLKEMEGIAGVETFPSRANFILFRTTKNAKEVYRGLLDRGVLVRDVSYMPLLENCLRVSVGKPHENDLFLEALREVLHPST